LTAVAGVDTLAEVADAKPSIDEVAMPALLRHARTAYRSSVRAALDAAGCDDMPPNGSYVVAAIVRRDMRLGEVLRSLQMSREAAAHLVDVLVARGYLERASDPDDARRLRVVPTERGELAADTVAGAVSEVDARLLEMAGAEQVEHARTVLAALIALGHDADR
jgi:DNA-binding MarR family transcriptional regulator